MEIETLRKQIDEIDDQLIKLLNARADIALKLGKLKRQKDIPILNTTREKAILDKIPPVNTGPLGDKQLKEIFLMIIQTCRDIQLTTGECHDNSDEK